MNKIFLLFYCCTCCLLSFGQEIVLEADFERERQAFIEKLNPVFAKIKVSDTEVRTILKSDRVAIWNLKVSMHDYYVQNVEIIRVDTIKELRKRHFKNRNDVSWISKKERFKMDFRIPVYEKIDESHLIKNNKSDTLNRKFINDSRRKAINEADSIYVKIEILTASGLKIKHILKKDTLAINEFQNNKEKYIFDNRESKKLKFSTTSWVKIYKNVNCCFGNCDDNYAWALIEVPIDTTIIVDVYQFITKEAIAKLEANYQYDYEKYKTDVRQKAIDLANPIYAKVQKIYDKVIVESIILKSDSAEIQDLKNRDDLFLYDVEYLEINTSFNYWARRITSGCNCQGMETIDDYCLMWTFWGEPIQTTEIIEIYRQQPIIENLLEIIKTDIAKASGKIDFKVYPNPFLNTITIEAEKEINSVKVFNQNGQILLEKKWNTSSQTLDLSHLPNGFYYLKVIGEIYSETVKLGKF